MSGNKKNCMVQGCGKRARGASGHCIAHGGGPRCQIEGCFKGAIGCFRGAIGKTNKCKAHGGGKRCKFVECVRSAEGRTDFCVSHGGGNRCTYEGCQRGARGKTKLCTRHGGEKGVFSPNVRQVPVVEQTTVSVTVGEKGASLKAAVQKAPMVNQTFAKHM